ncbi:RNA polymerase subunit sigma [Sphingomonas gei]|uniref:RNA polymerase subunit sigma n=1 Tax=Sphingomonas gei TaxID=1395960 RepID=A0A4S1XE47_9SPHN|nr:sigma-70 region 4 domain-containing protein [Sphingomonas gei]TGX53186.1 RNA polymerase subunit sigma [Sphingomonas gei]
MLEGLTDAEIIARLEIGLRRMPKMRREIFLAIRLDDMGYPEISERTGLSVSQVERQFAQALLQLHRVLNDPAPVSGWKRLFRLITGKGD